MTTETIRLEDLLSRSYRGRKVNFAEDNVIEEEQEDFPENIIHTRYWDLPENSLNGWRPFSAYIPWWVFEGPRIRGHGKGFSLWKDQMGGIHGSRGSGKSELLSFLLGKKMRSGKPVWTNYPISFFVIEQDGSLTYYESRPLDFNKFYAFSPSVRNGAVGVTELQYYVEARTSGKEQNRVATYQIMQIRKTALSFLYDVQDRKWVDKRFGWSNDFDIECSDIAKLNYDRSSLAGYPEKIFDEYGNLREGALVMFTFEDTSGVATGASYQKRPIDYGPFQFDAHEIWDMYPTFFIIDAYEAMNSYKKKNEKQEAHDLLANSLESAINYFLGVGEDFVLSEMLIAKASEIAQQPLSSSMAGKQLAEWGIQKKQKGSGKRAYNIGALRVEE